MAKSNSFFFVSLNLDYKSDLGKELEKIMANVIFKVREGYH